MVHIWNSVTLASNTSSNATASMTSQSEFETSSIVMMLIGCLLTGSSIVLLACYCCQKRRRGKRKGKGTLPALPKLPGASQLRQPMNKYDDIEQSGQYIDLQETINMSYEPVKSSKTKPKLVPRPNTFYESYDGSRVPQQNAPSLPYQKSYRPPLPDESTIPRTTDKLENNSQDNYTPARLGKLPNLFTKKQASQEIKQAKPARRKVPESPKDDKVSIIPTPKKNNENNDIVDDSYINPTADLDDDEEQYTEPDMAQPKTALKDADTNKEEFNLAEEEDYIEMDSPENTENKNNFEQETEKQNDRDVRTDDEHNTKREIPLPTPHEAIVGYVNDKDETSLENPGDKEIEGDFERTYEEPFPKVPKREPLKR